MKIYESAEDYLETILIIKETVGQVRSIDIAAKMNFSKPSVSVAMKKLRENGYISVDETGYIELLPPGEEIARRIYGRHQLLSRFLQQIGVDKTSADEEACKIEHDLSEETVQKIRDHLAKMEQDGCGSARKN